MRRCNGCNQELPLSEFRVRVGNTAEKEGRAGQPYGRCCSCNRKRTIKKHDGDMSYAIRALLWSGGSRRGRGEERSRKNLTVEQLNQLYVKQKGSCALSGFELTAIRGKSAFPTNVSIDRIDNSKGYTIDNIQLVCRKANTMKGEETWEELLDWCTAILQSAGRPPK